MRVKLLLQKLKTIVFVFLLSFITAYQNTDAQYIKNGDFTTYHLLFGYPNSDEHNLEIGIGFFNYSLYPDNESPHVNELKWQPMIGNINNSAYCNGWYNPIESTSDYFCNSFNNDEYGVPTNMFNTGAKRFPFTNTINLTYVAFLVGPADYTQPPLNIVNNFVFLYFIYCMIYYV